MDCINLGFIVPSLEMSVNKISVTILCKGGILFVVGILRGKKNHKIVCVDYWDVVRHYT